MSKRPKKPEPERVVRRPKEERKKLAPELVAFASGDHDALWRREQGRGRVDDPRPVAAIPGVKNADARAVYEARVIRMKKAIAAGDDEALGDELCEARLLGLWRANSIVGFDVLADAVLGLAIDRAKELARAARVRLGLPTRLDEAEVAVWMRAEAGIVVEAGGGRARLIGENLVLEIPLARAAEGLAAMGRREAPMVGQATGRTIVDRPRGVPSMKTILEREEQLKEK